jgi:aminocarboxymuconate-semialdehyde decarboxylase
VFEPATLRFMMEIYGTSQLVLGSDYPFALGEPDPVSFLERCGLDAESQHSIFRGNAARYLDLALAH